MFTVMFFLFTIFNIAVPLSSNWAGEIMCLIGAFDRNPIAGIIGSLGIVISAAYSIWLFNRIAFGSYSEYLTYTTDLNRIEYIILLPLLIIAILFGVCPNIVLGNLHISISTLIY